MAKDIHGKPYSLWALAVLVLVATFAGDLNATMLATAVPTLMRDFNISLSTAQQASTWFLLGNGIMIPVTAYLGTRVPTKILYLFSLAVLFLGGLVAIAAPSSNYLLFIVGRVIQSLGVGVIITLQMVIFAEIFPEEKRGQAMAIAGLSLAVSPALGPTFAGWVLNKNHSFLGLTLSDSWRSIFIVPTVIIGICLLLAPFVMRDVLKNKTVKLDILSLILTVAGFGLFLYGLTNAGTDGWLTFDTVLLPTLSGLILLIIFSLRQLKMTAPFLDLRLLTNKQFSLATLILAFVTMAMMGVEIILPVYLQEIRGLSALGSGLTLLPGTLIMTVAMPVFGGIYDKIGGKILSICGFIALTLATIPFIFISSSTPRSWIIFFYAIRAVSIAAVMMPMMSAVMDAVKPSEMTHASALSNTLKQVASALIVAVFTSVTTKVSKDHLPSAQLKVENPSLYLTKLINATIKGYSASFLLAVVLGTIGVAFTLFLRNQEKFRK
ncbi:MAG: DHA2 family efflux MFS transporter permease subunit [Streptococcaceae bacterium]|nr:DHA2 family efflux MFS transporter permease subunit [Streptococcaceae bacterium]